MKEGKTEYKDLTPEILVTCGLEDNIRKRGQYKKRLMKELVEAKENYNQTVSIACLNCDGMAGECIEAQDMITQL